MIWLPILLYLFNEADSDSISITKYHERYSMKLLCQYDSIAVEVKIGLWSTIYLSFRKDFFYITKTKQFGISHPWISGFGLIA